MTEQLLSYLLLYKYPVLFLVSFVASVGFPLPATALLMAIGAFALQGYFNFTDILIVAFLGGVLGDGLGYYISRRWGKDLLMRVGFRRILKSRKFTRLENIFLDHSFSYIFYSRFLVTGMGSSVNLISGLSKISYKKFFFGEFFGETVYVFLYSGLGYILGSDWQYISNILENLAILLVLIILIVLLIRYYFNGRTFRYF